jgi:hypothetical protein
MSTRLERVCVSVVPPRPASASPMRHPSSSAAVASSSSSEQANDSVTISRSESALCTALEETDSEEIAGVATSSPDVASESGSSRVPSPERGSDRRSITRSRSESAIKRKALRAGSLRSVSPVLDPAGGQSHSSSAVHRRDTVEAAADSQRSAGGKRWRKNLFTSGMILPSPRGRSSDSLPSSSSRAKDKVCMHVNACLSWWCVFDCVFVFRWVNEVLRGKHEESGQ